MPKPFYQDDWVSLYHGDALAILAGLPDASVDGIITDPPYSSGGATQTARKIAARRLAQDVLDFGEAS